MAGSPTKQSVSNQPLADSKQPLGKQPSKGKGKAKMAVQEVDELSSDDDGSFSLGSDSESESFTSSAYSSEDDFVEDDDQDEVLDLLKESEDAGQTEYKTGLRSGEPKRSLNNAEYKIASGKHNMPGSSKDTAVKRHKQ